MTFCNEFWKFYTKKKLKNKTKERESEAEKEMEPVTQEWGIHDTLFDHSILRINETKFSEFIKMSVMFALFY